MNQLNRIFLVLALLLGGAGSAHADYFVAMDPGAPGVFNTSWSIDGYMESNPDTHFAGGYFFDLFVFNVPDTQTITFSVSAWRLGVDFLSDPESGYALLNYADFAPRASGSAVTPFAMRGGPLTLGSGTYALIIAGTYLTDDATYAGTIIGTPLAAVPEPAAWLLMLAGLGGLASVPRLRQRRAPRDANPGALPA